MDIDVSIIWLSIARVIASDSGVDYESNYRAIKSVIQCPM